MGFPSVMPPALAVLLLAAPAAAQSAPRPIPPSAWGWDRFTIQVADWDPQLRVQLIQISGLHADLYLRRGAPPTTTAFDARSATPGTSDELIVLNGASSPLLTSGTWHIGVLRPAGTLANLTFWTERVPSVHPGLGANVFDAGAASGTAFRVWAPFAAGVNLIGDFNGWNASALPMVAEPGGTWSLDVRNLGAGSKYRFVVDAGLYTQSRIDPRARSVTNSVGDSIVVDPQAFAWGGGGYGTPAWNDMVVYEMHVGTFYDSPGGPVGTFDSARGQLPYLADLGVNVIEVMPVGEFAGDTSWGYNTAHPFAVESAYGGEEAFKRFVRDAHSLGLAVVLDVLYNHWGPSDLDLWRFDGWYQGSYGGIYFYNDWRAATQWGDTRPDYGRGEVRTYIRDNALFWLDEFRLDGLRLDSTVNIRNSDNGLGADLPDGWSLLQWINDEVNRTQQWKIVIAEDMWQNEWLTKDTGAGGAGFDSQWDAGFVHPMRDAIIQPNDAFRDMHAVRAAIEQRYNSDAFERVIFTESHDECANGKQRVPEDIWPGNAGSWYSKKRSTLGAAIVMTSPGVPMILQGQEFLEDGFFSDQDPLDWTKASTYSGIRLLYSDLIQLRRDFWGVTRGLKGQSLNVFHVNDADKLVAFHRWNQGGAGDDVLVLANFADRGWSQYSIGAPRAGTWRVRFNSDWNGYDPAFGNWPASDAVAQMGDMHGLPYHLDLSIGPYTVLILSQ